MNDEMFEVVELIEQAEQYKKKMGELHVKIIKLELEVENTIVRHLNSECNDLDSMVRMMSATSQRRKRVRKLKRGYEDYKKQMIKINKEIENLEKMINDELEIKDIFLKLDN